MPFEWMNLDIGEKKPSAFLGLLEGLNDEPNMDSLIKYVWLSKLPREAQMILAAMPEKNLDDLADAADGIVEVIKSAPKEEPSTDELKKQIEELSAKVNQLALDVRTLEARPKCCHNQARGRSNSRGNNQTRPPSSGRSKHRNRSVVKDRQSQSRGRIEKWCWYHVSYGINARNCIQPCSF